MIYTWRRTLRRECRRMLENNKKIHAKWIKVVFISFVIKDMCLSIPESLPCKAAWIPATQDTFFTSVLSLKVINRVSLKKMSQHDIRLVFLKTMSFESPLWSTGKVNNSQAWLIPEMNADRRRTCYLAEGAKFIVWHQEASSRRLHTQYISNMDQRLFVALIRVNS